LKQTKIVKALVRISVFLAIFSGALYLTISTRGLERPVSYNSTALNEPQNDNPVNNTQRVVNSERKVTNVNLDLDTANAVMLQIHNDTFHCDYNQTHNLAHYVNKILPTKHWFTDYGLLDQRFFKCGFCHQRNLFLVKALRERGYEANLKGLNGHVVAEYILRDKVFYLDADLKVESLRVQNSRVDMEAVLRSYTNKGLDEFGLQQILDAFRDDADDTYYDLNRLKEYEERQIKLMDIVTFIMTVTLTLFLYSIRILIRKIVHQ